MRLYERGGWRGASDSDECVLPEREGSMNEALRAIVDSHIGLFCPHDPSRRWGVSSDLQPRSRLRHCLASLPCRTTRRVPGARAGRTITRACRAARAPELRGDAGRTGRSTPRLRTAHDSDQTRQAKAARQLDKAQTQSETESVLGATDERGDSRRTGTNI